MVEPTDGILPILQRIQNDVADIKHVLAQHTDTLAEQGAILTRHTEQLAEMNGYLSFGLSITSRHTADNETIRSEIDAIKRRLAALEHQI